MTDRKPKRDTFTLTESGRKKLAALGVDVTPDDERRAGWQTDKPELAAPHRDHHDRPISGDMDTP